MRKRALAIAVVAASAVVATVGTVDAITDGEPDAGEHPYVGLMVAKDADGNPLWRCTGTMISPTVFLTAGHCTDGAAGATIWFEEEVLRGDPVTNYPFGGATTVDGTPYTHPDYVDAAFYEYDLGVVVLEGDGVEFDEYGTLPPVGYFDPLFTKRGRTDVTFEPVGYGLQSSGPASAPKLTRADLTRLKAEVRLIAGDQLLGGGGRDDNESSVLFSNNANTGGTCFGDSGGPIFENDTNMITAVTSFGLNETCGGTGGGYRIDQADDLAWIESFLGS